MHPVRQRIVAWPVCASALSLLLGGCPPTGEPNDPNINGDPNQPTAVKFVEVPDPLSGDNPTYGLVAANPPAPGQAVTDARLGGAQTRVTQTPGVRHEYSRHDPFNADQSLVLLVDVTSGSWRVYETARLPYDAADQLVIEVDLTEPRWDPNDPNVLWGLRDFRIETLHVRTGATTIIKDFAQDPDLAPILAAEPDLYRITMRDEGEASEDLRYWAFVVQGTAQDYRPRHVITWDRQQDRVTGVLPIAANQADIDWVGMSPAGTWVLIGGSEQNAGDLAGFVLANRELTEFHRIDYATGHADVGRDLDGREVLVMQNVRTDYIDLIPLDPSTQPILESGGSYVGTNRVPLVRLFYADSPLGLRSGVHISCNFPGYAVVSTYIEPDTPEQNWLDRSIVLVALDRAHPRAYYLAKVYGTRGAYWEETQATITRDGWRVMWATNWGRDIGQERVWDVVLTLPNGWPTSLTP